MGLGVLEVKSLTLVSFTQLLKGYYDRQEEQWDMTRHIMSTVMNYGGMGSSKFVSPEEVIKLSRDDRGKVRYITTMKSAIELLESMKPIILLSLNNRQE